MQFSIFIPIHSAFILLSFLFPLHDLLFFSYRYRFSSPLKYRLYLSVTGTTSIATALSTFFLHLLAICKVLCGLRSVCVLRISARLE
jgi:hypothetical protein